MEQKEKQRRERETSKTRAKKKKKSEKRKIPYENMYKMFHVEHFSERESEKGAIRANFLT